MKTKRKTLYKYPEFDLDCSCFWTPWEVYDYTMQVGLTSSVAATWFVHHLAFLTVPYHWPLYELHTFLSDLLYLYFSLLSLFLLVFSSPQAKQSTSLSLFLTPLFNLCHFTTSVISFCLSQLSVSVVPRPPAPTPSPILLLLFWCDATLMWITWLSFYWALKKGTRSHVMALLSFFYFVGVLFFHWISNQIKLNLISLLFVLQSYPKVFEKKRNINKPWICKMNCKNNTSNSL